MTWGWKVEWREANKPPILEYVISEPDCPYCDGELIDDEHPNGDGGYIYMHCKYCLAPVMVDSDGILERYYAKTRFRREE